MFLRRKRVGIRSDLSVKRQEGRQTGKTWESRCQKVQDAQEDNSDEAGRRSQKNVSQGKDSNPKNTLKSTCHAHEKSDIRCKVSQSTNSALRE